MSWLKFKGNRGTSLIRKRTPLGPYRRPMPRVLGGSYGRGRFLMDEVPLCNVDLSCKVNLYVALTHLRTSTYEAGPPIPGELIDEGNAGRGVYLYVCVCVCVCVCT